MSNLLVEQARGGSEQDFDELVSPHRRELHVHCYRMLGSFEDAEDAVQETVLRAWTRISTYAGTSTFRAWLYAISTNVCIDALRRRKTRAWPTAIAEATDQRQPAQAPADLPWLQPYPDTLLAEATIESAEDSVVRKETVELAFLAAIQHLPPRQRAVLILRDVLDWSAKEAATTLGMTPTAVNSALQRAHATLAVRSPNRGDRPRPSSRDERAALEKFVNAWEKADLEALAGLLASDARFVMPPRLTWFQGRANVLAFLGGDMKGFDGEHVGSDWRLVPTGANGQPAFGLYRRGRDHDRFRPFAIGLLQIGSEGIEEVSLFLGELARFELFELPQVI